MTKEIILTRHTRFLDQIGICTHDEKSTTCELGTRDLRRIFIFK